MEPTGNGVAAMNKNVKRSRSTEKLTCHPFNTPHRLCVHGALHGRILRWACAGKQPTIGYSRDRDVSTSAQDKEKNMLSIYILNLPLPAAAETCRQLPWRVLPARFSIQKEIEGGFLIIIIRFCSLIMIQYIQLCWMVGIGRISSCAVR